MTAKQQTVGEFLFDYLHKVKGVKHAFGIPGDFALPTFRWLEKSQISLINMTHEPSVGFAADAYARINGLGVAVVTYCVGGLNMLNSIACAYAEKSPVIVISGGPSPNDRNKNPLLHHKVRTFDSQRKIYEEVTCATAVLLDPETAADEIIRVVEEVQAQCRPGYIEVPFDVVDMPCKAPTLKNTPKPQSDADSLKALLEEALPMLNNAKKPVIVADIELHRFGLMDKALEIAEKFNIPIAATLLSKSVFRETHPLYLGVYAGGMSEPACQEYVESSDCVIMLGAFISDVLMGFYTAKLDTKKAILVTSEEARVGFHNFDNILFGDFVDALLAADINKRPDFINPNPAKEPKPLESGEMGDVLEVEDFFRILGTHMADGSTVICDTGDALMGAIPLRTNRRRKFLSDAYYLSMGFAVPAAIGATANAEEGKRVFAIVGDGAFQMTGTELSTAAKFGLAPIVMILNNGGYGTQRHILDGKFNEIQNWNYSKICDLIGGGKSYQVKTKGELHNALSEAVKSNTLSVIECIVPRSSCSRSLKRLGEGLSEVRDASKRKEVKVL